MLPLRGFVLQPRSHGRTLRPTQGRDQDLRGLLPISCGHLVGDRTRNRASG